MQAVLRRGDDAGLVLTAERDRGVERRDGRGRRGRGTRRAGVVSPRHGIRTRGAGDDARDCSRARDAEEPAAADATAGVVGRVAQRLGGDGLRGEGCHLASTTPGTLDTSSESASSDTVRALMSASVRSV